MDLHTESPYRVFISYSHHDRAIAAAVEKHVREALRAIPLWDPMVRPGAPFSDELKEMISFAHVFVSVLTPRSNRRAWVHQEIGYAMAQGIPILPLAFGELPLGMADRLQALCIERVPDSDEPEETAKLLSEHFAAAALDDVVARHQGAGTSFPVLCAPQPEDRTLMLVEHLAAVAKHNGGDTAPGVRVRHEAPYGTFSLPDKPPRHRIWRCRDGANLRSEWLRSHFRRERRWTAHLAERGGLDLILHPDRPDGEPLRSLERDDPDGARLLRCALRTRLEVLTRYLESMPDNGQLRVVVSDDEFPGNTLVVGDWFIAETVSPSNGRGFRHTIITRHAPTVSERVKQFDADFRGLLEAHGVSEGGSLQKALQDLTRRLEEFGDPPCGRQWDKPCPLHDRPPAPRGVKGAQR